MSVSKKQQEYIRKINLQSASDNALYFRNQHEKSIDNSNKIGESLANELSTIATIALGILTLIPDTMKPTSFFEIIIFLFFSLCLLVSLIWGFINKSMIHKFWLSNSEFVADASERWFKAKGKLYDPNNDPVKEWSLAKEKQDQLFANKEKNSPLWSQYNQILFLSVGLLFEFIYYLYFIFIL